MKDNQADGELMMDAKTITDWERSEASVGRPAEHADYVIDGMHCAACVTRVEKAIQRVPGVLDARVNLVEERAQVDFDRASVGHPGELDEAVRAAVERAGYEAQPAQTGLVPGESIDRQDERAEARESDYRERIRRFWIGAALTVPVVLIGHGMWIPGLRGLNAETMRTLHALSGLLTLPLILYVGRGFFTGAWAALRRGESNMDTLVALGTGSAWVYSTVAVLAPGLFPEGTAHPFYEATAVVITLVVLGQALEARAKGRTSRALRALADLRPETAHVIREGREVDVAAADLVVGDVIVVRPGERIPIDGVVRSGSSAVNEAIVTGESMPVRKAEGDSVVGGTMNTDGTLTFEASAVGSDTVLARITEMVRRAQGSKPPIQRLVDIVAGYFVPAVVLIAFVAFVVWMLVGPDPRLNYATVVAVAVLVISCPCALGLATPISIMIGIGKAAENGILIRSGEALERARSVDTVILDKTGTITVGSPAVAEVRPLPDTTVDELLEIAGRVEVGSEHPVGRAIVDSATAARGKLGSVTDFVAVPGLGVRARVEDRVAWVGSVEFLTREGVDCQNVEELVGDVGARAQTPVVVAWDGRARGVIGVADPVKPDSLEAIDRLRSSGKRVIMITGDHPATARAVADELGVSEVLARVLPGEKAAKVSALQAEGRVIAMVGDGVNDAPALAQADVGIAIGTGTDVAFEAADLTLMGGSLGGVVRALEVSDATFRNIRQNLVGAFVYNVIGIPVAAGALYPAFGILLSPVIAGAAMAFSSVTVVTNANRLRNFRPTAIG